MNRDIKFRAWDKKSKKMRQVVEIVWNTGLYLEPNDNTVKLIWVKGYDCIEEKDIMMKREKGFELMQYTGLHDKNGNEIYEGDILNYDDELWIVEYQDGAFKGFWDNIVEDLYELADISEIVGNIYENSDLVGGINGN